MTSAEDKVIAEFDAYVCNGVLGSQTQVCVYLLLIFEIRNQVCRLCPRHLFAQSVSTSLPLANA